MKQVYYLNFNANLQVCPLKYLVKNLKNLENQNKKCKDKCKIHERHEKSFKHVMDNRQKPIFVQ